MWDQSYRNASVGVCAPVSPRADFCEAHHFDSRLRSIVFCAVGSNKKHWRARVVTRVCTSSDDGRIVDILPGDYTLSEVEGARYQLVPYADKHTCLSIWFAEVLVCAYMGQLEILGVWP